MENENNVKIDWVLIGEAVAHYSRLGFEYIETPWMVSKEAAGITCPDQNYHDVISRNNRVLVASAEQGFLQLDLDGKLQGEKYVSCGPCFRISDAEENKDGFHQETFFKVELYVRCDNFDQAVEVAQQLATTAVQFMGYSAQIVPMGPTSWDIEYDGIEVGSYGAREYKNLCWAYGTGIALPRWTQAVNRS